MSLLLDSSIVSYDLFGSGKVILDLGSTCGVDPVVVFLSIMSNELIFDFFSESA